MVAKMKVGFQNCKQFWIIALIPNPEINNRKILNHGWVNFPLAYTQVNNIYLKLL